MAGGGVSRRSVAEEATRRSIEIRQPRRPKTASATPAGEALAPIVGDRALTPGAESDHAKCPLGK
jgi:hypothetical protein